MYGRKCMPLFTDEMYGPLVARSLVIPCFCLMHANQLVAFKVQHRALIGHKNLSPCGCDMRIA